MHCRRPCCESRVPNKEGRRFCERIGEIQTPETPESGGDAASRYASNFAIASGSMSRQLPAHTGQRVGSEHLFFKMSRSDLSTPLSLVSTVELERSETRRTYGNSNVSHLADHIGRHGPDKCGKNGLSSTHFSCGYPIYWACKSIVIRWPERSVTNRLLLLLRALVQVEIG